MENYKVLSVIGEGSFGRALLVCGLKNAEKFVMKEIRLPKSSAAIKESRQEAILLAKMKHPNIVKFREAFEADDHLYIVMEYCDRGDLLETIKLQKGKLFPEHTVLHWFVQMCLAVQHIHEKRVLHRDIKSKNIFLTQRRAIKLGDFGSARVLSSPIAYACTYVGTPYYVPPEIWENSPYNNKSDVWSLGCVLYEICSLKHPFQAGSWKNLILKICHGTYSPLPSHYSYELRSLIKQIFRKDPRQRPSVNTILKRRGLLKMVNLCASAQLDDTSDLQSEEPAAMIQPAPEHQEASSDAIESRSPVSTRKQWEKGATESVLGVLEKASILTSSIGANRSEGGLVVKYDPSEKRKEWNKEEPETLLNILNNLDLWSAFKTYTIYRSKAPEDCLKGLLFNNSQAPDATDSREEQIEIDPERLATRSDDEDTDFEEDEVDPDWILELQKVTDSQ
ncbi:serine/threonine-protein kinase Nek3-like isoform X4 [Ranitomeya variabilis]|uniref:serine/threonine-protein kinase Nek3-like isoform X4 n=1 Tax=Ranitomeya variabilis TaxID=490064 RepID=UPI0040564700